MGPGASLSLLVAVAGRDLRQRDLPSHGRRCAVRDQSVAERPDRATPQSGRARCGRRLALMFKRVVRIVLIGGVAGVLLVTLAMVWLKIHEDELVFAAERSRQHLLPVLPADAERVAVPLPNGGELAGLVFRAAGNANDGFWVLHLHGNADSAFSP